MCAEDRLGKTIYFCIRNYLFFGCIMFSDTFDIFIDEEFIDEKYWPNRCKVLTFADLFANMLYYQPFPFLSQHTV